MLRFASIISSSGKIIKDTTFSPDSCILEIGKTVATSSPDTVVQSYQGQLLAFTFVAMFIGLFINRIFEGKTENEPDL